MAAAALEAAATLTRPAYPEPVWWIYTEGNFTEQSLGPLQAALTERTNATIGL
jgi:hypothetical protein